MVQKRKQLAMRELAVLWLYFLGAFWGIYTDLCKTLDADTNFLDFCDTLIVRQFSDTSKKYNMHKKFAKLGAIISPLPLWQIWLGQFYNILFGNQTWNNIWHTPESAAMTFTNHWCMQMFYYFPMKTAFPHWIHS